LKGTLTIILLSNMSSIQTTYLSINGSFGEGGGQLLRNSISYATMLKKSIHINNIRSQRPKPGLQAQHLTALKLCAEMSRGTLLGCEIGSTEIYYSPSVSMSESEVQPKVYFTADTQTAGSICLLLQASLPVAMFSPLTSSMTLVLKGGTNATLAPSYDYWKEVFLPKLLLFQPDISENDLKSRVLRRGYFPRGGGEVQVDIIPRRKPLRPIILKDRGVFSSLRISSYYAGTLPRHVAIDAAEAALHFLQPLCDSYSIKPVMEIIHHDCAVGSGSGMLIVAQTTTGCCLAGTAIGDPRKRAFAVGKEAADELLHTIEDGGCMDEWLQDQFILYMVLADGVSEILTGSLTRHTQTAIWVAEKIAGVSFEVLKLDEEAPKDLQEMKYGTEGRISGKHLIRCHGIGFCHPT
jgi:RNA 3'-terminal phosphate cyclase (ATP)